MLLAQNLSEFLEYMEILAVMQPEQISTEIYTTRLATTF